MTSTEDTPKTISLSEFAARAVDGEAMEQELNGGETVSLRVFTPAQEATLGVQRIWTRILALAHSAASLDDIPDEQLALAYELGFACLRACVRDENGAEIPDAAIVDLFSKLPYESPLMTRCQEMCGVSSRLMTIPPLNAALMSASAKDEDGAASGAATGDDAGEA